MNRLVLCLFITSSILTSCSVYKPYSRPQIETESLFRDTTVADTVTLASLPWRELFTDTCLQRLITKGLECNTDLEVARLRTAEAEAVLFNARLSYLPAVSLGAEGAINRYDDNSTKPYHIAATASWELDLFGKLTAAKRGALASYEGAKSYRQAVQTRLIATIADCYYTLLMLDEQFKINLQTQENWRNTVRVLGALKRNGKSNETAVLQAQANLIALENNAVSLQRSITETENELSAILGQSSQTIPRGTLDNQRFTDSLAVGIPVHLLSNRPDVQQAEFELAQAFYATNVARAAFYPSITLSGTLGWTNNGGNIVTNPGNWLMNAIGSLVQPLFNKGANIANLKIAKARQEEAKLLFQQSLFNAGQEVNDALTQWQSARQRILGDNNQLEILQEAVKKTELLMRHSNTTYLEVLTTQQSLLDAQTALAKDCFDEIQAVINLYHALGGGVK